MAAKACTYPPCLDFAAYAVISRSIIEQNKSISRHEWSSEYLIYSINDCTVLYVILQ